MKPQPAACAMMASIQDIHPHGRRQPILHDDLMAAIWCLHQQIHRDNPPPQNAREQQAAFVLMRMRQTVLGLVRQGVPPARVFSQCAPTIVDTLAPLPHDCSKGTIMTDEASNVLL
jgi:hypothetical protein